MGGEQFRTATQALIAPPIGASAPKCSAPGAADAASTGRQFVRQEASPFDTRSSLTATVVWLSLVILALLLVATFFVGQRGTYRAWTGGSLYAVLVTSWLFVQILLGHAEWRRQRRFRSRRHEDRVAVLIPTYNEDPSILRGCVQSALNQDYDGPLQVVVVDDGGKQRLPSFKDLVESSPPHRSLLCLRLPTNQGKRHAQAAGLRGARGDYLVTMDSDTRLDPRAVDNALLQFEDPRVGAVTGVCLVDNRVSLLTRLIHLRYWNAFCQERASQSYLGVVTCCSGVFSVYRRRLVDGLTERYLNQRFLGRPCHYGDDRHLTNLLLWEGHEVRVALNALAWTQAPTRLLTWARQQRRWSQSFYREFLWSLRFVHRRNFYFAYCLFFQASLPLLLLYGLGRGLIAVGSGHPLVALRYAVAVVVMALLRGAYGMWLTRDPEFLLMPLYGFLHLFVVLPVRVLALFSLWDNRWGTR